MYGEKVGISKEETNIVTWDLRILNQHIYMELYMELIDIEPTYCMVLIDIERNGNENPCHHVMNAVK